MSKVLFLCHPSMTVGGREDAPPYHPITTRTPHSKKKMTNDLLVGHFPWANEEEEGVLTVVIMVVSQGSARGPVVA